MSNNVEERNQFVSICNYISNNYLDLRKEFDEIFKLLNTVEGFGLAYRTSEMMEFHFKIAIKKFDFNVLNLLMSEIKKVNNEAAQEFFQEIDIINIYDVIIEEIRKGNIIKYVWEARKALQYILYGLERIHIAKDINKKIAVLKGMLAYY